MLKSEADADKYKEVTAAEMQRILDEDAKFVRPPQVFIDEWNIRAGKYGRYNEDTGYFELNGLTDISYSEALEIMRLYLPCVGMATQIYRNIYTKARTLLPVHMDNWKRDASDFFYHFDSLQVLQLCCNNKEEVAGSNFGSCFGYCGNLREIRGVLALWQCNNVRDIFYGCRALESVRLSSLKVSISFAQSPRLSLASVEYVIKNAANTAQITITLHPDVYARIQDETNEEWHALAALAADKNIIFATS